MMRSYHLLACFASDTALSSLQQTSSITSSLHEKPRFLAFSSLDLRSQLQSGHLSGVIPTEVPF